MSGNVNISRHLDGFSFSRFVPEVKIHGRKPTEQTLNLINCYRMVFADHPWNEWKRCPVCGKQWGFNERDIADLSNLKFIHCGVLVSDYWQINDVWEDVNAEIKEESSAWLASLKNDGQLAGFIWGYTMNGPRLSAKVGIVNLGQVISEKFQTPVVAYLDDTGVTWGFRGMGIASRLYSIWLEDMKRFETNVVVARTQGPFAGRKATVLYHWFVKMGFEVIARYPEDHDHRADVILAKKE